MAKKTKTVKIKLPPIPEAHTFLLKEWEARTTKKPEANELAVGDRVRWRARAKREYLRHFVEGHTIPSSGIGREDLPKLQGLIEAVLARRPVYGKVVGYGAMELDGDGALVGRRYVKVEIDLGIATFASYFEEKDFELAPARMQPIKVRS